MKSRLPRVAQTLLLGLMSVWTGPLAIQIIVGTIMSHVTGATGAAIPRADIVVRNEQARADRLQRFWPPFDRPG